MRKQQLLLSSGVKRPGFCDREVPLSGYEADVAASWRILPLSCKGMCDEHEFSKLSFFYASEAREC